MVISNAKYGKKQGNVKNRAYMTGLESDLTTHQPESLIELEDLFIPHYEEIKFLDINELTK